MSTRNSLAERNLLFGILAVQMNFISRDDLLAAMSAWMMNKHRLLADILRERKVLAEDAYQLLDALVRKHLEMHGGDAEKSLAAVGAFAPVRHDLQRIADPDIQASIAPVAAAADGGAAADAFATLARSAGSAAASPGARFRILRPHARGGIGEVFVAEDRELHREVALKEIQSKFADDPTSRRRFVFEAEVTGDLEHPGVVPVYALGQYADGRPFYAMRFIKGDSLKEAVERFEQTEWDRASERTVAARKLLARFLDVCNVIAYAHSRGVLHRDLKPSNIMLGKYGETLVVDWGLAKAVAGPNDPASEETPLQPSTPSTPAETLAGSALGTPQFMSPEQAAGQHDRVGLASDIYSLGATLYVVLTGQAPFPDNDVGRVLQKVRCGEFSRPRQVKPAVPPALEAICLKAMAREPPERYASPRALADDIEHWLADEPVTAYRESWLQRAARWARRHQRIMTAATVLLVVSVTAGALLLRERTLRAEAERNKDMAQIGAFLDANADAAPRALEALQPIRAEAVPVFRHKLDDPQVSGRVRIRAALGLLADDPGQVPFLRDHVLEESDPQEVLLIADALLPYREKIVAGLWQLVESARPDRQRADRPRCLRALAVLARCDPDSPRWPAGAAKAIPGVLEEGAAQQELWKAAFRPVRGAFIEPLKKVFRESRDADDREAIAEGLADYAADQPGVIADLLLDADARQFLVFWPRVQDRAGQFIPLLEAELDRPLPADVFDAAGEQLARRQAQAAVALLQLGRADRVWPLLRHSPDPRRRSYLIHLLEPLHTDVALLLARWPQENDVSARRALLLALGMYDPAALAADQKQAFTKELETLYGEAADPGLLSAIDWLLRCRWHMAQRMLDMDRELAEKPATSGRCLVTRQGHTMALVPGPVEFDMGAPLQDPERSPDEALHRVRIPRSFAIATKEVTAAQFHRFLQDHPRIQDVPASAEQLDPATQVSWYDAARYCRWLSEQAGVPEEQMCFPPVAQIKDGMTLPADYLRRSGYRLATEAEWEYACRAGAVTSRFYGNDVNLLPHYAWFQAESRKRAQTVGQVKPNDLGLFDVLGNAREWCMDIYADYPAGKLTEDVEGRRLISDLDYRVIRGSGFIDQAFRVRCAMRIRLRSTGTGARGWLPHCTDHPTEVMTGLSRLILTRRASEGRAWMSRRVAPGSIARVSSGTTATVGRRPR